MPGRHMLRLGTALVAAGALLLAAPLTAAADDGPSTDGHGQHQTDEQRTEQRQRQIQQIEDRIAALQRSADAAGRTAQKADERYLKARGDAHETRLAMLDAQKAASAAATTARASRARASALAARLARTDLGTMPIDLMLNSPSANRVLGGLSTAGQLTAEAHQLYRQASTDAAAARAAQDESVQRSHAAARAAAAASDADHAARHQAHDAQLSVRAAKQREAALLKRFADQGPKALASVCSSLDQAPDGCAPVSGSASPPAGSSTGSSIGDRVVAFARAQIGEPYVFAAAGPSSWDCSGLTLGAYAANGISIGIHSATAQYRDAAAAGELVPVEDARRGDLLFYTDGGGDMYHITIYSGDGSMIEAPYPGQSVREVPVRTADLLGQAAHIG